jgi:hypothetical protein
MIVTENNRNFSDGFVLYKNSKKSQFGIMFTVLKKNFFYRPARPVYALLILWITPDLIGYWLPCFRSGTRLFAAQKSSGWVLVV